jgi:AFG3 family protein
LLEKETLDLRTIIDVLGNRPFEPKSNFKAYLDSKKNQEEEKPIEKQEIKMSGEGKIEEKENKEKKEDKETEEKKEKMS